MMDILYEKIIDKCKVELKISESSAIIARCNIDFGNPPLVIKGFTIKKSSEDKLFASAPSFRTARGTNSPILWMPREMWNLLTSKILTEYENLVNQREDEISIDDPIFNDL